jgi:hypothetical protein
LATIQSITSSRSSVAFVVRLKSMAFPTSAARLRAYTMVDLSTGKFSRSFGPVSVSPEPKVIVHSRSESRELTLRAGAPRNRR